MNGEADFGQPRKELTWSRKWHIVSGELSTGRERYLVSLCGTYLENPDTDWRRYPKHLQEIKDGKRKSTGDCKICAKMSGHLTPEQKLDQKLKRLRALADELVTHGDMTPAGKRAMLAILDEYPVELTKHN